MNKSVAEELQGALVNLRRKEKQNQNYTSGVDRFTTIAGF